MNQSLCGDSCRSQLPLSAAFRTPDSWENSVLFSHLAAVFVLVSHGTHSGVGNLYTELLLQVKTKSSVNVTVLEIIVSVPRRFKFMVSLVSRGS